MIYLKKVRHRSPFCRSLWKVPLPFSNTSNWSFGERQSFHPEWADLEDFTEFVVSNAILEDHMPDLSYRRLHAVVESIGKPGGAVAP